jgi:hypothetical protein
MFRKRHWSISAAAWRQPAGLSGKQSTDQSQGVQLATIQKCTLLRDRIRLAQDRDEDERPAAVRNSFQKRFAHASDHCANSGTGSPDSGLLVMTPVLNLIRDCQITHRFNWGIFEGGTV